MQSSKPIGQRSIRYYQGKGVMLSGVQLRGRAGPGGKRGQVKGWSSASRRRMREYMLTHEPEADSVLLGTSFTIPGPPLPLETVKGLWKDWCRRADKRGWSAVWRMEVQKRGQLHWHCMLCVPLSRFKAAWSRDHGGRELAPTDGYQGAVESAVRVSWEECVSRLGAFEFAEPVPVGQGKGRRYISAITDLMAWPGADERAAHAECQDENQGAWMRYLQDHASKAKQEQIGQGVGRHWGVIGRKRFIRVLPDDVAELSGRQFARFLKCYQRMCTPQLRDKRPADKRCAFGRRLGRRVRRGSWGKSVWFSRVETVKKLVAWASTLPEEMPGRGQGADDKPGDAQHPSRPSA